MKLTIDVEFCVNVALYVLSRGLKQPECKSDHLSPPSAEARYQGSCLYKPLWRGQEQLYFKFTLSF
jgi:hypothetical protein